MNAKNYLILISLFFMCSKVSAEYPKSFTDFALLPPYCKAKLNPSSAANTQLWAKKLGQDFSHTHHYCAGLHSLRIAKTIYSTAPDKMQHKNHLLSSALGEIEYMEKHASPKYILFPHIYTTKAEVYLERNQANNAIKYFNTAINANKKFTKPYALLSDYYVKINNHNLARDTLEKGLKYSPKSKALNKRIKKLSK